MAQARMVRAPWAITTVVSCLPVLVLGMGTALAHLLRADAETTDTPDSGTRPPATLRSLPRSPRTRTGTARDRRRTGTGPRAGTRTARRRAHDAAAGSPDLASGLSAAGGTGSRCRAQACRGGEAGGAASAARRRSQGR
jgi:hypothetical protein